MNDECLFHETSACPISMFKQNKTFAAFKTAVVSFIYLLFCVEKIIFRDDLKKILFSYIL